MLYLSHTDLLDEVIPGRSDSEYDDHSTIAIGCPRYLSGTTERHARHRVYAVAVANQLRRLQELDRQIRRRGGVGAIDECVGGGVLGERAGRTRRQAAAKQADRHQGISNRGSRCLRPWLRLARSEASASMPGDKAARGGAWGRGRCIPSYFSPSPYLHYHFLPFALPKVLTDDTQSSPSRHPLTYRLARVAHHEHQLFPR